MDDRPAARAAVARALELDPTRADAWSWLGQIAHSDRDLGTAEDALARSARSGGLHARE